MEELKEDNMTKAQKLGIKEFPYIEQNEQGKGTYYEDSKGYWSKKEYNEQGLTTYYEDSKGYWRKYEYNEKGEETYCEDSKGDWYKYEYNEQGEETYYENSDGDVRGTKNQVGKYYKLNINPAIGVDIDKLNLLAEQGWKVVACYNDELILSKVKTI